MGVTLAQSTVFVAGAVPSAITTLILVLQHLKSFARQGLTAASAYVHCWTLLSKHWKVELLSRNIYCRPEGRGSEYRRGEEIFRVVF
jgi:hypothetical protein